MKVVFRFLTGTCAGEFRPHEVPEGSGLTIGRALDNGLALETERTVSSHHAIIENEGGRLIFRDTGSTNGSYMYNRRVTKAVLQNGDRFRLGQTGPEIEVIITSDTGSTRVSPPARGPAMVAPTMALSGRPAPPAPRLAPLAVCGACGAALGENFFVCYECQRPQCFSHYDAAAGVCGSCAQARAASNRSDVDVAALDGQYLSHGVCNVCGEVDSPSFFMCYACRRQLCLLHHNPHTGLCTDCS